MPFFLKFHSEIRSSGEVAGELLEKFGENLASPGSFQKLSGSLTPPAVVQNPVGLEPISGESLLAILKEVPKDKALGPDVRPLRCLRLYMKEGTQGAQR